MSTSYIVVEYSGHEGEKDVYRDSSFVRATRWMHRFYTRDEQHDMHVQIAFEDDRGRRSYTI
jgi:hypothetical protein